MRKSRARAGAVEISFLGTGDAFASDGRFQSGYLLQSGNYRVLMEAGPTILCAMKRMKIEPQTVDLILISHLHGDHFGGLPYLILEYLFESAPRKPITIAGPRHLEERTWLLFNTLYPHSRGEVERLRRKLRFVVLEPGTRQRLGRIAITTMRTPHMRQETSLALRFALNGKTIAFSGDSGWTESLIDFTAGADLFMCECTFFESTHLDFHMNYPQLEHWRPHFDVGRMILTHIGCEVIRSKAKVRLETASDGLKIRI